MDTLFLDTATAFRLGFEQGQQHGYTSMRQALAAHPTWTEHLLCVFLNGVDDGVSGDRWRLRGGR